MGKLRKLAIFLLLIQTACLGSGSGSGEAITSTAYYLQTTDVDSVSLDITLVLYSDNTFKLYATRGTGTYNYYAGSFTSNTATIPTKTCATFGEVTIRGFSRVGSDATMLWDSTNGSGTNLSETYFSTKPSGFIEYTTATESCHSGGIL